MSLKIGIIYEPPAATYCALDPDCSNPGLYVEAARIACQYVRLNCTFSWFNSTAYGDVLDNGTVTGFVGAVYRGEFDTSIPFFAPTYRRSKAITFSSTFGLSETIMITRAPINDDPNFNWSIINSFQWPVWLTLIITIFLLTIVFDFIQKYKNCELSPYVEIAISLLEMDFDFSTLKFLSIRILTGAWFLGLLVLYGAYTGFLFSKSIRVTQKLPFVDLASFVQCLENEDCSIISHTESESNLQQLTMPGSDLGEKVKKILVKNPIRIVDVEQIPKIILDEKNRYLVNIGPKNTRLPWINGNRDCLYYVSDFGNPEMTAFPIRKNSSHIRNLNKVASIYRETGLEVALTKKYIGALRCDDSGGKKMEIKVQTSLESMQTIFYFYGIGIAVGGIVYVGEILIVRRKK